MFLRSALLRDKLIISRLLTIKPFRNRYGGQSAAQSDLPGVASAMGDKKKTVGRSS
jgi:hypothetical protein